MSSCAPRLAFEAHIPASQTGAYTASRLGQDLPDATLAIDCGHWLW